MTQLTVLLSPDRRYPAAPGQAVVDSQEAIQTVDFVMQDSQNDDLGHGASTLLSRSRSPQPYHRQKCQLLEAADKLAVPAQTLSLPRTHRASQPRATATLYINAQNATATSDSGTEADDEHFLKGLPAPKRLHKGLRGQEEVWSPSGYSTPALSPAVPDDEGRGHAAAFKIPKREMVPGATARPRPNNTRRNREITRRTIELVLLGGLGSFVRTNHLVQPILYRWRAPLYVSMGVAGALVALYPLRLIHWRYRHRPGSTKPGLPLKIPSAFDPAPLIYPPAVTLLVSSLIAVDNEAVLLPNIILALCALPPALFPAVARAEVCNPMHWLLTCSPLLCHSALRLLSMGRAQVTQAGMGAFPLESAVLLYPIHRYLSITLHTLTTTSLLPAELQLLSVALINVLFLSTSPQATILKAMLWVGGLDLLVSCSKVVRWAIALARVPRWRFKRGKSLPKQKSTFISNLISWKRMKHDLFHAPADTSPCSSCDAFDDTEDSDGGEGPTFRRRALKRVSTTDTMRRQPGHSAGLSVDMAANLERSVGLDRTEQMSPTSGLARRHTLSSVGDALGQVHTPTGRRKRWAPSSFRSYSSLTQQQATARKWLYASYVYVCIVSAVFVPHRWIGVKAFVQEYALHGSEPIGWALGYLLGDLPWFRFQVVSRNLERWICLPSRIDKEEVWSSNMGWVQQARQDTIGEANARLLLSAYFVIVVATGLLVVFRLSPVYEVDTRRKVFHFTMVAMLLPSVYIDPAFAALALSIVLGLFLLLDLLRASQLPPLSKPLATFLAPYVDGRDLRGPVVISHIFLLIGCAIPLWLSLGSLPRTGSGYVEGWELPRREVSMVSGIVCVGLGDAAASLIGRRYGRHKWLWRGGKSLEGSLAFTLAVFVGLVAAGVWLRVGGWPSGTAESGSWPVTLRKMGTCAATASLTEAVLTGGNDNVIVPVILWACVKSVGI